MHKGKPTINPIVAKTAEYGRLYAIIDQDGNIESEVYICGKCMPDDPKEPGCWPRLFSLAHGGIYSRSSPFGGTKFVDVTDKYYYDKV